MSVDWNVIHLGEFCAEESDTCDHDLMLTGIEGVFDLLNSKCRIDDNWRKREGYGIDKMAFKCCVCLQNVAAHDHPLGIFGTMNEVGRKNKAKISFVLHDLCLAMIAMNKDTILSVYKKFLSVKENVQTINKYSMHRGSRECAACGQLKDGRIYNCSDMFCRRSFHLECAQMRKDTVFIDFHGKTMYCQDHNHVQSRPNESELRGEAISQSKLSFDSCPGCIKQISRWPGRYQIIYAVCCESFIHYDCVMERLERLDMKCPRCGKMENYLMSIQRQGKSLMEYRPRLAEAGIDITIPDPEVNKSNETDDEYDEEPSPKKKVMKSPESHSDSSTGNKENNMEITSPKKKRLSRKRSFVPSNESSD